MIIGMTKKISWHEVWALVAYAYAACLRNTS